MGWACSSWRGKKCLKIIFGSLEWKQLLALRYRRIWEDNIEMNHKSIIALMMEAACTSETSVDIQLRTWQYIPEDSELYK
jgi:hypothetical protein